MNLMSTRQFAQKVGVTPETVRRWVRSELLKPYGKTVSGQYRFSDEQIEAALNRGEIVHKTRSIEVARHVSTAFQKARMRRMNIA